MKEVNVVCAYVKINGNILIAKRASGDSTVYGKWEFPGGKLEPGETQFDAIERELKEELDIKVKAKNFIVNTIHEYPNKVVNLNLIECEYISGEIKLNDHLDYDLASKEELLTYDLAPADVKIAEFIVNNL